MPDTRKTSSTGLRKLSVLSNRPEHDTGSQIWLFSADLLDLMTGELEKIIAHGGARDALVIDRTGCVLAFAGTFNSGEASNMAATAAATVAALRSMVAESRTSELSVQFHESDVDTIHFVLIDERLILVLLHSRKATGSSVRTAAHNFLDRIIPALQADKARLREHDSSLLQSVNYIENKLDELFKDTFTEME